MSGMRINYAKSDIVPLNLEESVMSKLWDFLGVLLGPF